MKETKNIKVLIVCNGNALEVSSYVIEQSDSLKKMNIEIDFFLIKGRGGLGYFKNYHLLINKIKSFNPDLIHAHYGLSGLFANLQRKVPVIVTYHGSDINLSKILFFSKISMKLAKQNIFVSKQLENKGKFNKSIVIPCGVDLNIFKHLDKSESKKKTGLSLDKKYVLFSSSFDNTVKNYSLAKTAIEKLTDVVLIELKGYTREEVVLLMNGVDLVLLTSFNEGSPQIVKEAMACNCPIVATNVGDVKERLEGLEYCYITEFDPEEISEKMRIIINSDRRTKGRTRLLEENLDINAVANKIYSVYKSILKK